MRNFGNEARVTRIMGAVAAGFGDTQTSAIIDMAGYEAVTFIVLMGAIAAGGSANITVNQGNDPALADTAVVEGAAVTFTDADDGLAALIDIRQPTDRYLEVDIARAVANVAIDGVLAAQYRVRDLPVTQDATVLDTVVLVSPPEV